MGGKSDHSERAHRRWTPCTRPPQCGTPRAACQRLWGSSPSTGSRLRGAGVSRCCRRAGSWPSAAPGCTAQHLHFRQLHWQHSSPAVEDLAQLAQGLAQHLSHSAEGCRGISVLPLFGSNALSCSRACHSGKTQGMQGFSSHCHDVDLQTEPMPPVEVTGQKWVAVTECCMKWIPRYTAEGTPADAGLINVRVRSRMRIALIGALTCELTVSP